MRRLAFAVVLLLSGCTADRPAPVAGRCLPAGSGSSFPDVAVACLDGSGTVRTGQLTGPAVVNLWASWCAPCREELPALQRFASSGGRVIGVNTGDTRPAAQSIVDDLGLTFPNLFDDGSDVRYALDNRPLPITVFVDGGGRVAFVYNDVALTDTTLASLAAQHLGTPR